MRAAAAYSVENCVVSRQGGVDVTDSGFTSICKQAAAGSALLVASLAAQASLVFDYSFTNTIGSVAGTVTGKIYGLSDNATGAASSVTVESFPAGLASVLGGAPINASLWDQRYQNIFTVAAGGITDGHFWAQQTIDGFGGGAQLYINGVSGFNYNFLNIDGTNLNYVWGNNGSAVFSATSSVPEPTSFALAGLALLGLAAARRKTAR